jgi:hypothetical protein
LGKYELLISESIEAISGGIIMSKSKLSFYILSTPIPPPEVRP